MLNAIDEMLRPVSPVTNFFRTATRDHTVGGRTIRKGQALMMCYPPANRDAAVFEDPFRFDVTRKPGRHIEFGYVPHVCLGQHLAKLEMRIFFDELLGRVGARLQKNELPEIWQVLDAIPKTVSEKPVDRELIALLHADVRGQAVA